MSFGASLIHAVYRLSGVKKLYSLPEDELLKAIEKANRGRGFFLPADHKAYYEKKMIGDFPCLIVRAAEMPAKRAILFFFGGGMVHLYEPKQKLLRLPGLYRLAPVLFCKLTPKYFGETAGFAATEYQTSGGVWRIDMTKCPYHDTCVQHGCPELCPCFCDSDDITYDGLHPKLRWHRTKTLGRGDDCCDFYLGITE